ncbi:uncharacterized protein LOC128393265 [Panonychus citri]|uniref:uncharacterized protein LOC128393265 n=1 Tax=Panonychus citri TaxID=50023 RepID=UPI0023074197|nr:uncharacterized protein LOC128393265 [Panonychus citri]
MLVNSSGQGSQWTIHSNQIMTSNISSQLNNELGSNPKLIFNYLTKSYPGLIYIIATVIFYIIIFISLVFSNFYANSTDIYGSPSHFHKSPGRKSRDKKSIRRPLRRATFRSIIWPSKHSSCCLDPQLNERLI